MRRVLVCIVLWLGLGPTETIYFTPVSYNNDLLYMLPHQNAASKTIVTTHGKTTQNKITDHHDFIFKVVAIGDAAVGKSTMLERYVDEVFRADQEYISTIGVDFKIKTLDVETHVVQTQSQTRGHGHNTVKIVPYSCKLQIWDTAGQERFKAITQSYYRSGNIFIVCFDISSYSGSGSMYSVMKWIKEIDTFCDTEKPIGIYVVGMRMDKVPQYEFKDVIKSEEFIKCVTSWESFKDKHIKFMGICSSKKNQYLERDRIPGLSGLTHGTLNSMVNEIIDSHALIDLNKRNSHAVDHDLSSVNMLFEDIVKDYINYNLHSLQTFQRKPDIVHIDKSKDDTSRWCCTIL